jgi:hypothetical protein
MKMNPRPGSTPQQNGTLFESLKQSLWFQLACLRFHRLCRDIYIYMSIRRANRYLKKHGES